MHKKHSMNIFWTMVISLYFNLIVIFLSCNRLLISLTWTWTITFFDNLDSHNNVKIFVFLCQKLKWITWVLKKILQTSVFSIENISLSWMKNFKCCKMLKGEIIIHLFIHSLKKPILYTYCGLKKTTKNVLFPQKGYSLLDDTDIWTYKWWEMFIARNIQRNTKGLTKNLTNSGGISERRKAWSKT